MSSSSSSSKRPAAMVTAVPTISPEDALKQPEVWLPGMATGDESKGGEVTLEHDPDAYILYHPFVLDWPSLSFDYLKDTLGDNRKLFPQTMFMVTGSMADLRQKNAKNTVKVVRVRDIARTSKANLSKEERAAADAKTAQQKATRTGGNASEAANGYDNVDFNMDLLSDDEEAGDMGYNPDMSYVWFTHPGTVNRIRACPQVPHLVATWSEDKSVYIWDIKSQLAKLSTATEDNELTNRKTRPNMIQQFTGHADEGYAMDWSPVCAGHLLTGDSTKYIYYWEPSQSSSAFKIDLQPFVGHTASVEDIQWSPTESNVFASCSADGSIKVWDTRERKRSMLNIPNAHSSDVNVISWNPTVAHLLTSGGDDGAVKIWDLRALMGGDLPNTLAAHYVWHKQPITSVQFHPTDQSVLAAASADNSISIWDMGLEPDTDIPVEGAVLNQQVKVPQQLLFLHQGQKNIKEVRWHPQIPGLCTSTAADGFNIFKPANIEDIVDDMDVDMN